MEVKVLAPAKINLTLNIEGRREDGYHLLSSVFQTVSLADEVYIRVLAENEGITLTTSDPSIPTDIQNTAYKAATLFYEHIGKSPCVSIHIDKCIPHQAGLGGGSADAAAVFVGLNSLYNEPFSLEELCALGERVGADVPFCIVGGTAFVEGIGEKITPVYALPFCHIVIAKPPIGVSTKEAYAAVDSALTIPADQQKMLKAIEDNNLPFIGKLLNNAFEQALTLPQVDTLLEKMKSFSPLGCAMSGSGSAVFALFDDKDKALVCHNTLADDVQSYLCTPLQHGAVLMPLL